MDIGMVIVGIEITASEVDEYEEEFGGRYSDARRGKDGLRAYDRRYLQFDSRSIKGVVGVKIHEFWDSAFALDKLSSKIAKAKTKVKKHFHDAPRVFIFGPTR